MEMIGRKFCSLNTKKEKEKRKSTDIVAEYMEEINKIDSIYRNVERGFRIKIIAS